MEYRKDDNNCKRKKKHEIDWDRNRLGCCRRRIEKKMKQNKEDIRSNHEI